MPNYGVEGEPEAANIKKDGRRRKPKDKYHNYDIEQSKKEGAISHYNNVLDGYKKYEILQDWGIFDFTKNPIENIIMDTPEEVEFVNSMKLFARYNT